MIFKKNLLTFYASGLNDPGRFVFILISFCLSVVSFNLCYYNVPLQWHVGEVSTRKDP